MLGHQPDRVRAALIAVQDTGRQAIAELRGILHLLRGARDTPTFETALPPPVIAPIWWRRLLVHSAVADVVLAAGLVLASDVRLLFGDVTSGSWLMVAVSAAVAFLAIVIRRHVPLTALVIAALTTVVDLLLDAHSIGLAAVMATMAAMCSVATHTATRRSIPAAITAILAIGILVLIEVGVDSAVVAVVWLAIPWFGGRGGRAYRRQAEQLRTFTIRLGRERDARARLAVINERIRVARDLHDSVAHAVSVTVLQAGAAEQVMGSSPARARAAIIAVETQGRQAVIDLHHLLGLLDRDGDSHRAPQSSLARLDTLLSNVARTGLPITLRVQGQPAELPSGLDISAYRIVQEGLTNTLKHAGPVPTTVPLTTNQTGSPSRSATRVPSDPHHRPTTVDMGYSACGNASPATAAPWKLGRAPTAAIRSEPVFPSTTRPHDPHPDC
jgi:signal transduction histidine kinase